MQAKVAMNRIHYRITVVLENSFLTKVAWLNLPRQPIAAREREKYNHIPPSPRNIAVLPSAKPCPETSGRTENLKVAVRFAMLADHTTSGVNADISVSPTNGRVYMHFSDTR